MQHAEYKADDEAVSDTLRQSLLVHLLLATASDVN